MNSFRRLLSVQSRRCLHSSNRRLARQETNVMNVFDRKVNEDTSCLKNFNALKILLKDQDSRLKLNYENI